MAFLFFNKRFYTVKWPPFFQKSQKPDVFEGPKWPKPTKPRILRGFFGRFLGQNPGVAHGASPEITPYHGEFGFRAGQKLQKPGIFARFHDANPVIYGISA